MSSMCDSFNCNQQLRNYPVQNLAVFVEDLHSFRTRSCCALQHCADSAAVSRFDLDGSKRARSPDNCPLSCIVEGDPCGLAWVKMVESVLYVVREGR